MDAADTSHGEGGPAQRAYGGKYGIGIKSMRRTTHYSLYPSRTRWQPTMQYTITALYDIGTCRRPIKPNWRRSFLNAGCLFDSTCMLVWGDWLGRRKAIIPRTIIMIMGVIIQVTSYPKSQPLAQFIIGRIIAGVGNGSTHPLSLPTKLSAHGLLAVAYSTVSMAELSPSVP